MQTEECVQSKLLVKDDPAANLIIVEEDKHRGSVMLSAYMNLIKKIGLCLSIILIFVLGGSQTYF